jgi:multidrug resistance efflux pump
MKIKKNVYLSGLLALIFVTGCATTQELKTSITSKVSSITSTVDPAIVNQVPVDKREGFSKAEFDLNVANQKAKLAELKSEIAAGGKKAAGYEADLAVKFQKEAEIDYDLVKIAAIINSGLGKKEDNLKTKANLQAKKLEMQADRIKINANLEATIEKNKAFTEEAAKMEEAIKAMKFDGGKAPESAPAPSEKAPAKTDKTEVTS